MLRNKVGIAIALVLLALVGETVAADESQPVSFTHDVQPILSSKCYACHGFDSAHRAADLRLDVWESPDDSSAASAVIEVGDPDASYLLERITSDDPDVRMPPADSGDALSDEEVAVLRKWIEQGAKYDQHWAFVPPRRPAVPEVSRPEWVRNPIDAFVMARLDREGLKPSPRASADKLARRLHLDLVGLPPTVEVVRKYAQHESDAAYAKLVDELLASPHYGERWARMWLDAARYADSDGFEKDKPREVWMYRDWVIEALNANKPYDEFVIEQIAGDLLENPTQDQRVATGFLRNSMINEEGGADPEQFRMEALYDRMDAVGKGVLGLTLQCAQCHTHKYDPLTHTDYYRLFAFLNNSYEGSIPVYTDDEQQQRKTLFQKIRDIEQSLRNSHPDWQQRMAEWEASVTSEPDDEWTVVRPELDGSGGQKFYLSEDGSVQSAGYSPTRHSVNFIAGVKTPRIAALRLEVLTDPNLPLGGPGRSPYGLFALSEFEVIAMPIDGSSKPKKVRFSKVTADANATKRPLQGGFFDNRRKNYVVGPVEFATDGKRHTAWSIDVGPGRSNVSRQAVFVLDEPLEHPSGFRFTFTFRQEHGAANSDDIWNNNLGRFRFSVTPSQSAEADTVPRDVRKILAIAPSQRTPEQCERVFSHWRTTVEEWSETNQQIEALWQKHPQGTSQLVLHEMEQRRTTYRHDRGDFLSPREEVTPGVPEFLHALDVEGEPTRLDLARWLVDERSPTTARSMVNRVWQAYFGTGIAATVDDLGLQSDVPSHPELLDWLAVEFMESGWSLKHLHRLIVSSATYQQASEIPPALLEADPDNRLLARGARFRVEGEVVRDIALAASGLLSPKIGGPSVYPPAPTFLFEPPASYGPKTWDYDEGEDKYRRALYTFRFRSVPYPALGVFDSPNGDVSCVRRSRSNTPLQALTTLNEPLFLECAQELACRAIEQGGETDSQRLDHIAMHCLARSLDPREQKTMQKFLDTQRERFQQSEQDPRDLLGEDASLEKLERAELAERAAWVAVSRVILNLDETVTKE